jgi:hypothetical protein
MKGKAPTKAEKQFHDRVASLGCIACKKENFFNPWVSIHHIDGRTKPGAHMKVLPLCGPHHQDSGDSRFISVHPWKARFEFKYGTQEDLLAEIMKELNERDEPNV